MFRPLLIMIALLIWGVTHALDFDYPVSQIAKSGCRFERWETLTSDCKQNVPRLTNAQYGDFVFDTSLRRVYTVLWQGTYNGGWDVGSGSHLGVDIATSAGTPVLAIADGEVMTAWWLSGWGNAVVIRHTLTTGKVIFSNYAHLEKVSVKKGDSVKKWTRLGAVGSTGNSTGNHLHWQIDTTNSTHPYFYSQCAREAGIMETADRGLCQSELRANTMDPIRLVELGESAVTTAAEIVNPLQIVRPPTVTPPGQTPEPIRPKTREEIEADEIREFLSIYSVQIALPATAVPGKKSFGSLRVSRWNKPFIGSLPAELTLTASTGMSIFPQGITLSEASPRTVEISSKKEGVYFITAKMWSINIGTYRVVVASAGSASVPKRWRISVDRRWYLGSSKNGTLMLLNAWGQPQRIAWSGSYTLAVTNGKGSLCPASTLGQCLWAASTSLAFDFNGTDRGLFRFSLLPSSLWGVTLELRDGQWKKVSSGSATVRVQLPRDFSSASAYSWALKSLLMRGILTGDRWYILPKKDMTHGEARELISRELRMRIDETNDPRKRRVYRMGQGKITELFDSAKTYDRISRGEALRLWSEILAIEQTSNLWWQIWVDENASSIKGLLATLRQKGFSWKDSFGERYFQSEKVMSREEGAYLFQFLIKNWK